MYTKLEVPETGIYVYFNTDKRSDCFIKSDLKIDKTVDDYRENYNLGVEIIEDIVLTHFSNDVDVFSSEYAVGIKSAILAIDVLTI